MEFPRLEFSWFARNRAKLVHALRMTASGLAAFILAEAMGQSESIWAVITALIVTQSNVGGSLKAALDYFAGSLLGAIYGIALAFTIPHTNDLTKAVVLVLAMVPLSYMAAISPGFRAAPITGIIVLLAGSALGALSFAMDRVIEVGIGCAVGVLVSVLVLPVRASHGVLDTTVKMARLQADQLEALTLSGEQARTRLAELEARRHQMLSQVETLIGAAARERRSGLTGLPDPEPMLRTLLRLRNDVSMLRSAVDESDHEALPKQAASSWMSVARTGASILRGLANSLSTGQAPESTNAMKDVISDYKAAVDEIRRSDQTSHLSTDSLWRLSGTGFVLDQFRQNLDDLVEQAGEFEARR